MTKFETITFDIQLKLALNLKFLKIRGVLFYKYITLKSKTLDSKNVIQWKNLFQNAKEKAFLMREIQKNAVRFAE